MKHLKTYENLKDPQEAQEGDYIILDKYETSKLLKVDEILYIWQNFLKNNIGKIKNIYYSMDRKKQITIVYENVPIELQNTYLDGKDFIDDNGQTVTKYQRTFLYDNIEKYFTCSNNIEDLNQIIKSKKYNI